MGLTNIYIGLGSNLGDRLANISRACAIIEEKIGKIDIKSSMYVSPPWGFEAKEDFYNAVIKLKTTLDAGAVLKILKSIELDLGRIKLITNGYESRTIDLDIIDMSGLILKNEDLILPHPQMHKRKFVLVPLIEIEPKWTHPIFKETAGALLKRIGTDDLIQKLDAAID